MKKFEDPLGSGIISGHVQISWSDIIKLSYLISSRKDSSVFTGVERSSHFHTWSFTKTYRGIQSNGEDNKPLHSPWSFRVAWAFACSQELPLNWCRWWHPCNNNSGRHPWPSLVSTAQSPIILYRDSDLMNLRRNTIQINISPKY